MIAPRILVASVVVGLTAALLVGCTPTNTKLDSTKTPKPSTSASPSPSTQAPGITDITDTPGSGAGLVGALADSKVQKCALADGKWQVEGSVTNPTTGLVSYRIYVSLLDGKGGTRALQQVDVDKVKAAATTDWKMTIATAEQGLNCVLRVERYGA